MLKRAQYYPNLHGGEKEYTDRYKGKTVTATCWGRIVKMYIFRKRKWTVVGEYCQKCGAHAFLEEFEKGLGKK